MSCQTSPAEKESEPYLVVDYVPDLVTFSPDNTELRFILKAQIDLYENIMMHLLSMRTTGDFIGIDLEIEYCQEILDYLDSIVPGDD